MGYQLISVIQRVKSCDVSIGGKVQSSIQKGLLVLLGIEDGDNHDDIKYITHKIIKLRIFNDNQGRINFSVDDV